MIKFDWNGRCTESTDRKSGRQAIRWSIAIPSFDTRRVSHANERNRINTNWLLQFEKKSNQRTKYTETRRMVLRLFVPRSLLAPILRLGKFEIYSREKSESSNSYSILIHIVFELMNFHFFAEDEPQIKKFIGQSSSNDRAGINIEKEREQKGSNLTLTHRKTVTIDYMYSLCEFRSLPSQTWRIRRTVNGNWTSEPNHHQHRRKGELSKWV